MATIILAILLFVFPSVVLAHQGVPPQIVAKIPKPKPGFDKKDPTAIEAGRRLFEKATFGGNGRTCATCHAAKDNFALSPANVQARPATDPLFVFEQFPELAALENQAALRTKALITENVDGFDQPGVLRSVPHIFGLGQTINPEPNHPLRHATGWGGDGSPGSSPPDGGSLRNFAVGAIVQHFTRTLARVLDVDFVMPTQLELDQLEAFQLSVGRQTTPVIDPVIPGALVFSAFDGGTNVIAGQTLFAGMPSRNGGTRRCSGCHTGGGALNDLGQNEQRANGNEVSRDAPTCVFTAPGDGGFGLGPAQVVDKSTFCTNGATGLATFRGNRFFSTASAIEAADTLPAFHDNSAHTIEEVVDFYRSETFNDSITGAQNGFVINDFQRDQLALFVRILNVLENIRSAMDAVPSAKGDKKATAKRDIGDAIRVLKQGTMRAYQLTALPALLSAQKNLSPNPIFALVELERARGLIVH